ncbi:hypothetical protein EDB19DRAFT_1904517 [Suillus lakei]|nr:hypothetical protein EDB19DRAFT_1904517 [Suillus lakei]
MASEDDICFSLLPPVYNLPSPVTPPGPSQSTQQPLSHNQMEAMLAHIRFSLWTYLGWVSSTPTIIPPLTMRESGSSVPLVGAPPVQSPVLPVAGPSSVPV